MTSLPSLARTLAGHLSHGPGRIGIVVERVGAQDGRERTVVEGKLLGVGDQEPDVLDAVRQLSRSSDHLRGEIHPEDEPRHGTRRSRRGTRPASHVEEQVVLRQVERSQGRSLDGVAPPGRRAAFIALRAPIEPSSSRHLGAVHRRQFT
jgi:hypothetical protein